MTSTIQEARGVLARHRSEMGSHYVALACLFLVPTLLSATTYYLSPSGSDSNPGTQSQPFRTVAQGITVANPGDTLILADGTYRGDTPYGGGSTFGWLLWINKSGAPGAPITIKAQNSGMAVLDCGNSYNGPQTGCLGYIYFGDPGPGYWVLDGLVFQNTYDIAVNMNSSTPAHDITIQHCTFQYIGQHSSTISTGMDGVYVGEGQYNLTFNANKFTNIGRTGGSNFSHDHGLYLHSSNTVVMNNLFFAPITGWGVQTAAGFSGLIANNTFAFNMNNNGGQLMLWDVAGGAITVQNNIFFNPTGGFAVNNCALQAPSLLIDHNIVTNGTIGGNDTCGGGMSPSISNTISADPMFVNASSTPYNFYYQPGSPAIDAGVTLPQVSVDFAGTFRPQGSAYDIGAYEYIFADPPPVTPASPSSTPPSSTPPSSAAPFAFSLSDAARGSVSANPGLLVNDIISVALLAGTGQPVRLSISGAPGIEGWFDNNTCTPACSRILTVSVSGSVAAGMYNLTLSGSGGGASAAIPMTLTVGQP